jgi:hypothetical protein
MNNLQQVGLWALVAVAATGCEKARDIAAETANLELRIDRLEELGPDYRYEGWIVVDGRPRSTGTFEVDADGQLAQTSFAVDQTTLDRATEFMVTIEPAADDDPAPSNARVLGGDFSGGMAELTIAHAAAFGQDFSAAKARYMLAVQTSTAHVNPLSGIWFQDPDGRPGLDLPALPAGWRYEGWVVMQDQWLSTGKFERGDAADQSAQFSGALPGPAFPGEDFLTNAPQGLTFPTDLSSHKVVITVEPVPDNSAEPFFLKPLFTVTPVHPFDHAVYTMSNQAEITLPAGLASRVNY